MYSIHKCIEMKSNFFNRVVNLIAISKQKKIIEKNIIFFSMTFLEMAALFNFMFLMEMLIFFYKSFIGPCKINDFNVLILILHHFYTIL